MWHLYILRCVDNTLYIGITTNLPKRIENHNHKKGAKYLLGRLPVRLVYSEAHPTKSAALKRELQLKKLTKTKKELLVLGKLDT